jgi:hypothetical protein
MIPTITHPTSFIVQPSTKKELKFRPFLVKEEKILLMAKESGSFRDIMYAIKEVVGKCCLEPTFDVNKIPIFDLEILYLHLRAISVNNIEKFKTKDNDDNLEYDFLINLYEIKLKYPEKEVSNVIKINKDISVVMKYPSVDLYNENELEAKIKENGVIYILVDCIEKVFEKDVLIMMTDEEKVEFLNSLDIKSYNKMKEFITSIPVLEYTIYWTNSLGKKKFFIFNSLKDFFFFL